MKPCDQPPRGPLAVPGEYSVTLAARRDGKLVELGESRSFTVKSLPLSPETSDDPASVHAFKTKAGELHRAVQGAVAHSAELGSRIAHLKAGLRDTPRASESDEQALRAIETRLADINVALSGDRTVASRNEPVPWSIAQRAGIVYQWLLDSRADVPAMYEESYAIAAEQFATALRELQAVSRDLDALEQRLETLGTPWTPGRTPGWQGD